MKYMILGVITGVLVATTAIWLGTLGVDPVWVSLTGYLFGAGQGLILMRWMDI